MTRVFVQPTGRRIHPFDDPVADALVHNRPLSAWQQEAFREAGLTVVDDLSPPCLVVPDTLLTTGPLLRRFVKAARGRDAVLGIVQSAFGRQTTPVQPDVRTTDEGHVFDAIRFVSGEGRPPVVVWLDVEETTFDLPLPKAFQDGEDPAQLALPRHPVITLHHWVHLLWANQAWAASRARRTPWWRGLLRVLWAVVRARSLNRWRILARLNTIGRGCDIHPTATVEASTLGDGVTVGPYARVLFSTVGDGATIMAGAHVEASTLGPGATAAQMTGMRVCVLYPEAFHGQQMMQACILGEGALTTLSSHLIDLDFGGHVRVPLDGAFHDAGTPFLGSAVGHGCRIGTGTWLAPGRAIPNHTVWMRDPERVGARVPTTTPDDPVVTRGGSLVPWRPTPR